MQQHHKPDNKDREKEVTRGAEEGRMIEKNSRRTKWRKEKYVSLFLLKNALMEHMRTSNLCEAKKTELRVED